MSSLAISSYLDFYRRYLAEQWHNMTPAKYGVLLIAIGVVGFLLMKNGTRR